MGLLDDAIREHLELKRLHGADPGEVAREEHAALGSPRRSDDPVHAEGYADHEDSSVAEEDHRRDREDAWAGPEISQLSQETMELDMQTLLVAGASESEVRAQPDREPWPRASRSVDQRSIESDADAHQLEWEMPVDRGQRSLLPVHGVDLGGELSAEGPLP